MLARAGIISDAERDELLAGLDAGRATSSTTGTFPFRRRRRGHPHGDRAAPDRDRRAGRRQAAHRALAQRPGRDRRGAVRARARARGAARRSRRSCAALSSAAERHLDWPMPGYTHLQRAQPVYLCHHLLAYFWMLRRDRERFARRRAPRPAAAARRRRAGRASTSTPTAGWSPRELGFAGVAENSIDAVSNRDFVLDYLAAAATCATHLSRLGAEIVLWSSEEFGFCEVSDAWASGSSIMPQKKNPDAAELLRAKAPRVVGHLVGAPRRDARPPADLQQGHAGGQGAPVRRGRHARAVPRRGRRDARGRSRSTASAWPRRPPTSSSPRPTSPTCSCARGVPFREAHGVVAGARARAPSTRRQALSELTPEELAEQSPLLDEEFYARARRRRVAGVQGSEGGTVAGAGARAAHARARRSAARGVRGASRPRPRVLRPAGASTSRATWSAASSRHGETRRA